MGQINAKLRSCEGMHFMHWCPGCEEMHVVPNNWTFNGDFDRPTTTPSLLHTWAEGPERVQHRCHLFITDGQLVFCSDSLHPLAGKTVPIPPLPEDWRDA